MIEKMPAIHTKEQFLYTERPFEYVDKALEEIRQLESGEKEKIKLSPEEQEFLLEFESSLGEQLENIHNITPRSTAIYLEYFTTPEGQAALKESTGIELKTADLEEIRKIFWQNDQLITGIKPPAKRKKLAGDSSDYANASLLQKMWSRTNPEGQLDTKGINPPKRIQPLINPKEALEKIRQLRLFKQDILAKEMRRLKTKLQKSEGQLDLAALEILSIYRRRVNTMIIDMYQYGLSISQKKKIVGESGLKEIERQLLAHFPGISKAEQIEKNRSRIDKSWHGTSRDGFDEKGWRIQISQSMENYVEKLSQLYAEIEMTKSEKVLEKGLDESKLSNEILTPQETALWIEEVLEGHGLKSAYTSDTYDPARTSPAPDEKWQVVLLPGETTMEPDFKQKVMKDSDTKERNIERALSVGCGHEVVHILQRENQKKFPLRIFKKVGGSRFEIFSEGGAMHIQSEICREFFGFERPPLPHYTKAMLRKLAGGNYIDCVETYYESFIKPMRKKWQEGKINRQIFDKWIEKALDKAIDSSKRLFANGTDFESQETFLTNSKDTIYLEQRAVLEKLEKSGLLKLANMRGAGLHDIISLLKLDLLKLNDLVEYNFEFVSKIWEREKHKYLLKEPA
jgi:hypothetical protein